MSDDDQSKTVKPKKQQDSAESTSTTTTTLSPSTKSVEDASASGEKKLSNKELKELKKKEKAAKRAASKQANGITIEEQQKIAQIKKDKKQQQREKQLNQQKKEKERKEAKNVVKVKTTKKSTLFGHLETTEERRSTLLSVTGSLSVSTSSKITTSGLSIPMVTSAVPTSNVLTSVLGTPVPNPDTSKKNSQADNEDTVEIAKSLAGFSLESDQSPVLQGVSSIIPKYINEQVKGSTINSSVKELLLNSDNIHPAIISLTYEFIHYKIVGSIPRCIAMLEAFQIVISDYQTPSGTTLSRNLTNYLSHQIDILKKSRPLSVTMGNAIRWLKQEISHIDPLTSDDLAKKELCEKIAQFAREKIELADQLILETASNHIENGDTIMTYGSSKVLTDMIIHNVKVLNKDIKIIVVDSRPLFEGRKMAKKLRENGVKVIYSLITSLSTVFKMKINYVFLGAHSILSNGFLYSRAGSAMIAMSAKRRNIPVLICCESLKFSQRVQLDSVTFNELANSNDLIEINPKNPVEKRGNQGALLQAFIEEKKKEKLSQSQDNMNNNKQKKSDENKNDKNNNNSLKNNEINEDEKNILDGWEDIPSLNIVNILYDLTPPEYIKKIITEFGALPPSSVPVVLREYKGSV